MSVFDIFILSIVVCLFFLLPFALIKIISWLKKKIEPAINNSDWDEVKNKSYRSLKDDIRYFAIFYIFVGIVCMLLTFAIRLDDGGIYSLGASIVFIFGAIGIWKRWIWSPWITNLPIVIFSIYSLIREIGDFRWIYAFIFSVVFSINIMQSIREINTYELMR